MNALYTLAKENPVEAVLLVSLFVGALGDIGRIIEPKSPTIARVFKTLSALGISVLGVVRGNTPRIESPKDERGAGTVDVMATVAAVGGAVVIGYLVAGCGPSKAAALYGAKLEACLQTSTTCQAYIACRDGVQTAEGRGHYQASCEPSDAGADALVVDARADALEAGIAEGGAK
jgi:hypothetical protein